MRRHPHGPTGPVAPGADVIPLPGAAAAPVADAAPPPRTDGHLPSCGTDCRAGHDDPFLERVFAEYDALLEGLSAEEQDRLLRRAWIDEAGGVHVRDLRPAADPGTSAG